MNKGFVKGKNLCFLYIYFIYILACLFYSDQQLVVRFYSIFKMKIFFLHYILNYITVCVVTDTVCRDR